MARRSRKRYSGVTIYNADGTVKQTISYKSLKSKNKIKIHYKKEVANERDNERYVEWRSAIIRRDQHRCVLCGEHRWIEVHHIVRWADNIHLRYDLRNGVCLCPICHKVHHGPRREPFPKYVTSKLLSYISSKYGGENG